MCFVLDNGSRKINRLQTSRGVVGVQPEHGGDFAGTRVRERREGVFVPFAAAPRRDLDGGGGVVFLFRVPPAGTVAAAELQVERVLADLRLKKRKGKHETVRHCTGKLEEEAKGAEDAGVHRGTRGMAAECATPARNAGGLGARIEVRGEGNERGESRLFIGSNMEKIDGLNHWQSMVDSFPDSDARFQREEEDG